MKRYLSLLIVLIYSLLIVAQEKPAYEKKTFVTPEGKLFIHRDLGIYLWLSTSKDASSEKYLLKSKQSAKYSNPMYLDVEGYNTVRSPSAVDPETRKTIYPVQDIIFEIYADESAPVSKLIYGDSKPYLHNGKTYVMSSTEVSINANDHLSGVENIYISIDGKPYTTYSKPLTFSEEREYLVKYYAVDNVGNVEETHEIKFIYDKTPPVTKRIINTDEYNNIISDRSTISLEASDSGIGVNKIVYKINDGNEYTYTHPLRASHLSQGEHSITYYAIDKVGNREDTVVYSFYIDKTPPTIIEEVIGKSFFANGKEFSSGKAQLKLTAFDNKAGVKEIYYSVNGGEYQLYTKPVFLTQSSGNLQITTYATDNVNNKTTSQSANQKTSIPYIDLSGPTLTHWVSGPKFTTRDTLFINSKSKISLKGRDQEAGINRIEYSIDGSSPATYDQPFSIEAEGVHIISFTGYDNVENTNSAGLVVKVDNSGPEINYQFSTPVTGTFESKNKYPKYVILFLSGSDDVVGLENVKYGFNENTPKNYSIPITNFSDGAKQMKLIATDKLGNVTEEILEFIIEP